MAFGNKDKSKDSNDSTQGEAQNRPVEGSAPPRVTGKDGGDLAEDQAKGQAAELTVSNQDGSYETYSAQGVGSQGFFQSKEAAEALADPNQAGELDRQGIRPAKISDDQLPGQTIVTDFDKLNKLVKVKPRRSEPRFRVGQDWYSIQEGKETLVPKHVAQLLEEKGYL